MDKRNCADYPEGRMRKICRIVEDGVFTKKGGRTTYRKVDGQTLDAFTASAILTIYDKLSVHNRTKFAAMPIRQQAEIAFRFVK